LKNVRYVLNDEFQAEDVANDLKVQLDINRIHHLTIKSVENRNEVIVQIPEANESTEEVLSGFMKDYQKRTILE
jgi:hypothetical protein